MGVYTTPTALAAGQQRRFAAMNLTHRAAHLELINEGYGDHLNFTTGGVSSAQLRQMGHPFAREGSAGRGIVRKTAVTGNSYSYSYLKKVKGGGSGIAFGSKSQIKTARGRQIINPLPINLQGGALRRSLFKTSPSGADMVVYIGFSARHARYVLSPTGTRKMTARGLYSVRPGADGTQMGAITRRHKARSSALIRALRNKGVRP